METKQAITYQEVMEKVQKLLDKYDPEMVLRRLKLEDRSIKSVDIIQALLSLEDPEKIADMLTDGLYTSLFYNSLDNLLAAGLDINQLVKKLKNHMLWEGRQIQNLLDHGADPNLILGQISDTDFHVLVDIFTKDGFGENADEKPVASPEMLLKKSQNIDYCNGKHFIECLHRSGVDMDALVGQIPFWDTLKWSGQLLENGASIDSIAKKIMDEDLSASPANIIAEEYVSIIFHLISSMNSDDAEKCRTKMENLSKSKE